MVTTEAEVSADAEPEDERGSGTERRRLSAGWTRVLVSVATGLVAMVAAWKLRTIPVPTDPWHYVIAGLTFPAESWNAVGLTRYGMVLPMLPIARLFHMSEAAFYLTPVLVTGLMISSVCWITARLFGLLAGVAAAVLLMANSVFLVNSSRMYPDIFASTMITVAVMTALAARDRWESRPRTGPWLVTLLVLTGTFVGLSWWMRETAVLTWPAVAVLLLWKGGPPWRVWLPATALPALGLLGLELWISKIAFGTPWARFAALSGADLSQTTNPADLPYLGQSRLAYLLTIPKGFLTYEDGRWMVAMALVAVVAGLAFPRRVGFVAFWFVTVFAAYVAIGGALRPNAPNIRLDVARYWIAFLPPMVIAAVGGVSMLCRMLVGKFRGGARKVVQVMVALVCLALVAGPVAASAREVRSNPTYVVTNGNELSDYRNWLHDHDREVRRVFTDWTSSRILPVYERSLTGKRMTHIRYVTLGSYRKIRPGDHVVLFSARNQTCFFCYPVINQFLDQHPGVLDHWDKEWTSKNGTIEVYSVPQGAPKPR